MSAQHTPGPWKCGQYLGQKAWVVHMDVGDKGRGMDIVDGVAGMNNDERLANARLIAAAPDLLAALKEFHLWAVNQADAQSKGGHATFDLLMLREQRDIAEEAIAKATGEQA